VFTAATLLLVLVPRCLWMRWAADGARYAYWWRAVGGEHRQNWKRLSIPFSVCSSVCSFTSVGMSLNLGCFVEHHPLRVVISVAALVAVKILVLYHLLARLYGVRSSGADAVCYALSQGGELALSSSTASQRLFQGDQMALLLVTVTLP